MAKAKRGFRFEKDPLGTRPVPESAYWGIQTLRARENFTISAIPPKPAFITATAMVKLAACRANSALGLMDRRKASAIDRAASEIIAGALHEQFIVDVYQAGAGTSHNMNANEVIANRAAEILGGRRGDYSIVHPNDHVNMGQSSNDTFPTAMRLAAIISSDALSKELASLERVLRKKARSFDRVMKSGRTHLQDAVPVRLGQEFSSYASAVRSAAQRIKEARERLKRIGLGATAVGTGLNSHPLYRDRVIKELVRISGIKGLKKAPDTFEALSSMADFSSFSSALKDLAVELVRVANDLRLLSSGPATGLAELRLPPLQPGSSIMPGKVNPVIPEMVGMVGFQVIGNDVAVTLAAQAGQLELNVMGPVINHNVLQSVELLTGAVKALTEKCVAWITADEQRCRSYFERSVGLAAALNLFIGYERAAEVAKEAARAGRTVQEVVLERGIMTEAEWSRLMEPGRITSASAAERPRR